uniref:Uncharacterized protein n=1 Tax=Trichobilharzia regenti TaxID=157069 RepID=A0AA85JV34_TRIRE|nr:unnamed protein product [Trichobilharzia regenti]
MTNKMYFHILLYFFIAQICLNFTTSTVIRYPSSSIMNSLTKRRQFFEPLDPNLVGKLFNVPRKNPRDNNNDDDDEYYPNPPGNVMRYGKRHIWDSELMNQ